MKRLLLFTLLLLALGFAWADSYTIGTGTSSTSYSPYYGLYDYGWNKIIYTAAEINTAGLSGPSSIYGLGFYAYNTPANYVMLDQKVYVRHTALPNYGTATDETGTGYPASTGFTQVFDANIVYNGLGWYYVMFNAPFAWNGTSNLEILWENWDGDYYSGYPNHTYTSTSTNYMTVYKYADNAFPTTVGTRTYNRPNLKLVTQPLDGAPTANLVSPADGGVLFPNDALVWNNAQGMASDYDVYLGEASNPPNLTNIADMTYSPTLVGGNTYNWKIVSHNADGFGSASPIRSFTVPGDDQLAESFETATFPPVGWLRTTASTSYWTSSTTAPYHGTKCMYAYTSTSTPYTISTPLLAIDGSSTLTFYAKASATTQVLQIMQSTDRTNWTQVGSNVTFATSGVWDPVSVNLGGLTAGNYYLAFHSPAQSAASSIYVDYVVGPNLAVAAPGVVSLTLPAVAAADVSALPTFTWTAPTTGGMPTGYTLYLDTVDGSTPYASNIPGLTYTVNTALAYGTLYYWTVSASNGALEGPLATPRSFTTMTDPTINAPFFEGFEAGNTHNSTTINKWTQITGPAYTSYSWTANNTLIDYNRTPRTGAWNSFLHYSGQSCLIRPIQLTGYTNYYIELYARQDGSTSTNATIQVKYGTGASLAGMDLTIIPATGITNGDYQRFYGVFTPTSTGIYYIGIQGWINSSPWYISLDDITIDVAPDVLAPSALTSTNIDGDSADLGWTENNVPAATAWKIKYGPVGFDVDTQGTLINSVTTNPYPLTGLSSSTSYDWYVLSVTGSGSSTWSGPATFRTAQIPATLPLTEGWESGQGSWAFENGTQTNAWYIGTVDPFAGLASAYVSNDSGVSNAYTITTLSVAHIYRDITFGADNLNFPLTFEWKNAGESSFDRLRVYVVDTSVIPIAGTELAAADLVGLANYSVQPAWTAETITLPGTLSGSVKRLVFSWRNDGSVGTQPPINLDNISLTAVPVPSGPVLAPNLDYPAHRQNNLAKTGFPFQFSWNFGGTEPDEYNLYIAKVADLPASYDSDDFFTGATDFLNVTSPYNPTFTYDYDETYVWTVGGFNATYPEVYQWPPYEFTIEDDPEIVFADLPYTEDFDAVTTPAWPTAWRKVGTNGSAYTQTTTPNSSPNCVYMYTSSASALATVGLPPVNMATATNLRMKFAARANYSVGDELRVGYLTDPDDAATFTLIEAKTMNALTYSEFTVNLGSVTGIKHYAFQTGTLMYSMLFDDVVIEVPQAIAPAPATLTYPANGSYTLLNPVLKWTPGTGEPANYYKVYLNTTNTFNETHLVYNGTNQQCPTTGTVNGEDYFWKVVAWNDHGHADSAIWSFHTPDQYQLAESFEGTTFPPAGWARTTTSTSYWTYSTSVPYHGTRCTYAYASTTTPYTLSTPLVIVNGTSTLDFYAKATATTQVLQVLQSTDRENWTQVGSDITFAAGSVWYPVTVNLGGLTAGDYYLAFNSPAQTVTGSIYVDHVIGPEIRAILPNFVTQVAPGIDALNQPIRPTLSWTASTTGGVPDNYEVYVGLSSTFTPADLQATVLASPYTLNTALQYEGEYYWQIVAHNRAGDSINNSYRKFTVMSDPVIYEDQLPYVVDFGTTSTDLFPPTNWSRGTGMLASPSIITSTTSYWMQDDWLNVTTPANKAAKMNIYSTNRSGWLFTPPIEIPTGGYYLELDIGLTDYANYAPADAPTDDRFIILIGDGSSWSPTNVAMEWNSTGPLYYDSIPYTGMHVSIPLASYAGIKQIAFYGESILASGDNDFFVDNVKVWLPVANDLAATSITGNSAGFVGIPITHTVNVTNMGTADQSSFTVHLKKHGDERLASVPVNTPIAAGASVPISIAWTPTTQESFGIDGEVELTGDVNTGNNITASSLAFTVYAAGSFVEGFDGATTLPGDWTVRTGGTGTQNWAVYATNPHSAPNCMSVRYESTTLVNDNWLITPPLQLSSSQADIISFWIGNFSTYYTEDYEVKLSTTGNQIADFTELLESGILDITVNGYVQKSYNLDSYGNAVVYVALRYIGLDKLRFYADDFVGPPLYVPADPVVNVVKVPTGVKVSWVADPYAKHYKIYMDDNPYGAFAGTPVTTTTNEYIFTGADAKKFFKVVASTSTVAGRFFDETPAGGPSPEELLKMSQKQ